MLIDIDLSRFTEEQLAEIECSLNCWRWPDNLLGEEPDWHKGVTKNSNTDEFNVAFDKIGDIREAIEQKIGSKAIFKYWHMHEIMNPKTAEEFETWWNARENRIYREGPRELHRQMRYLGSKGHHVMVRYDPLRKENNFTVVVDSLRVGDTDNPTGLLNAYVKSIENTEQG